MKVTVRNLVREFGHLRALDGVSFDLAKQEILCVLGPSGSGKSTLLRCLSGLDHPTAGAILFDEQPMTDIHADAWNISVVFDEPRLIEHLAVRENIALGLRKKGWSKEMIDQRVNQIAKEVGLAEMLERFPSTLSAGQKQRVSLARALVRDCRLLLLDEALNNLDEMLRKKMIELLLLLREHYGFSCLYVTHSRAEAALLNGRVMILDQGKILQLDSWERLKKAPVSARVAAFLED